MERARGGNATTLAPQRLLDELGVGSIGNVHRAHDGRASPYDRACVAKSSAITAALLLADSARA